MNSVFLGLGGNVGKTEDIFLSALEEIKLLEKTLLIKTSRFFRTKPLSKLAQNDYLNAACYLQTLLDPWLLFQKLESIERRLGKIPKPKDAPRKIDIDLLFYAKESFHTGGLQIPHPEWQKRPFVIIPLLDLIEEIELPSENGTIAPISLRELLKSFSAEELDEVIPADFHLAKNESK